MLEVAEEVLKPSHSVEVEVVGRLIEEQVVRIAEESLGKHHAHLLLGRDVAHKHIVHILLDAKSAEEHGCIALGIPAIELSKLLFKLGSTHAVFLCHLCLVVDGILLLHDCIEHSVATQYSVDDSILVIFVVILFEHRKTLARAHLIGSASRIEFTAQYTQKSRFTSTVCTDNSITIAISEF